MHGIINITERDVMIDELDWELAWEIEYRKEKLKAEGVVE